MLFLNILGGVLAILLIIRPFIIYNPKIDLVVSKNKYTLLLWYNTWDHNNNNKQRTYIKIF